MLLTELILSKRGPLAKVWLSAHHERKLSKQQALGVDVGESVDAILTQDVEPMTLRLSGQLMLGVVRIYGRKVQYLMDDCKETRERISMAFRPGMVDLPEDQIRASKNSITFTDVLPNVDTVDILDWSFQVPTANYEPSSRHTATLAQTSLRSKEYGAFNFGRPNVPSIYGDNSSRQGSHDDTSSHLDSQDFEGVDLGLGLDDWDMSMEVGRDAQRERSRSKSLAPLKSPSLPRDGDGDLMDLDAGFDAGFEGAVDLNLGLDGFDDLPDLVEEGGEEGAGAGVEAGEAGDKAEGAAGDAEAEAERRRRSSSELLTPAPESPPANQETISIDVTPRVAKRIAEAQQAAAAAKPKRVRIMRADEELELPDEEFTAPQNKESNILGVERYIPSDPEAVRLRDIIEDPSAYFLPTIKLDADSFIFAGPTGLAPQLAKLFEFPTNVLRRHRDATELPDVEHAHAHKRPRVESVVPEEEEGDGDVDMETGRRLSRAPSEGFDVGMDSFDMGGGGDFGAGGFDLGSPPPMPLDKVRAPSIALSRAESIAREIQFGETGEHPLAMFDTRKGAPGSEFESQLASQSQYTEEASGSGGFSKTTGMAMGLLRRELEAIESSSASAAPVPASGSTGDKSVSFETTATGASKRAASAFFFELLVLGTRDCVKLDQATPFGDINVRAKPKLWETPANSSQVPSSRPASSVPAESVRARSESVLSFAPESVGSGRAGSVAPSIASFAGSVAA